jgi:hypothetical protein
MADDEIKAVLKQILDFLPTLATKADVATVEAKVDAVDAKVDAVDAKVDALRVDHGQQLSQLQADVTEIKRVVGVNHQRTMGHIEELRAIVTDHLEGHDGRARKVG